MEVTEIILAKVSRFGQLLSHSSGFLSDLRFLNSSGLGLSKGFTSVSIRGGGWDFWDGTNMFSNDVFGKATLNKVKNWTNQNEHFWKRNKTTKNPDENPDLSGFSNSQRKKTTGYNLWI
jgi:hypothetical protein